MSNHHRPTIAEIDLSSLRHNFLEVKKCIPKESPVYCIVKANAYGHGASTVAQTLVHLGVRNLGVATVEEGIQLRDAAIQGEIIVLDGLATNNLDVFSEYQLTPVLYQLEDITRIGEMRSSSELRVHLKLDTGMGRLGFLATEVEKLVADLKRYPHLKVQGVMTHLSRADEENQNPTDQQVLLFEKLGKILRANGLTEPTFHFANSAAILDGRVKEGPVRPGIMLYGSYPNPRHKTKADLKPVMTLKTKILGMKEFPFGAALSYGGTYVTKRESRIVALPIGYADGYPRLLSNRASVLVRGRRAKVVGRVCMDLTLVDVTEVRGAQLGDEVVLIGRQGDEEIRAEEVAQWADTISYEIFCGISSRVPRVYKGL